MAHKLKKSVVLYMPTKVIDAGGQPGRGARCGKCMMFISDLRKCTVVHKDGSKDTTVNGQMGVCGIYIGGKSPTSRDHMPMPSVSRSIVGYQEEGPTSCGVCEYFHGPVTCEKVGGIVQEGGCCNHQEMKDI